MREAQLEDLLRRDHALAARDGRRQAVEHGGLPSLRAAGDEDVEAGPHGGLEERRGGRRQPAELDQVVEPRRAEHELADVHRREAAADALEDDVQPVPRIYLTPGALFALRS